MEPRLTGIGCRAAGRLIACSITRRSLNFQLVQLIPFGVSTITLWYGKQFTHPAPWIEGRRSGSLNWSGCGFVLQGVPDLSNEKMNYGNHGNFKLANQRISAYLPMFSVLLGCGLIKST